MLVALLGRLVNYAPVNPEVWQSFRIAHEPPGAILDGCVGTTVLPAPVRQFYY
jgi:hypothetical protein